MRCSEQQDKQLMLGPLGSGLLLVRSKKGSCYRQNRWKSARHGWCPPPTFDHLTIAWRLIFLTSCHQTHKLAFFKPSSPRSPFQHHLATEGGCHGNATHMSRLPSLLPWQLVPHRISSMSLSVSLSLSYSLWVCLSLYFSHESVPTCLIRLSVPGKSLIAGLVSFSHHSLLVVYTPFTVYHLLNTAPCWVEQKFICIIIL